MSFRSTRYTARVIDSHCHLADNAFDTDLAEVIARAGEAGVNTMIAIADSIEEGEKCLEIAEKYEQSASLGSAGPGIFCTIGIHPHASAVAPTDWESKLIELLSSSPKVKAVGEIGLDYHYDFSPQDTQQKLFRRQLEIAKEHELPCVVHCREAVEDVWKIVSEVKPQKLVIHCCTDAWSDVQRFVDMGYLLSFTGLATYAKQSPIPDCIKACPIEQMMIETDSPYLAPVPHRGKRNEPAFVVEVAKAIAELKGISLEEVDQITTKNAKQFFSL